MFPVCWTAASAWKVEKYLCGFQPGNQFSVARCSNRTATLKILHIVTHAGVYRGGAVQACRMAEGLLRRGHDVTMLAAVYRKSPRKVREEEARTWDPLRSKGARVVSMNYDGFLGQRRLRRFIEREAFDVIHAHRDDALVASEKALRGRNGPPLVAQRGTISKPPPAAAAAFESPSVRAVVAVARAVRESLTKSTRIDASKVHVVYGSVDLEVFSPRQAASDIVRIAGFPEGSYVVGSLSAFRKAKGFEEMITALTSTMKQADRMRALFLGRKVVRKVKPLVKHADDPKRFRFVGHQVDVPAWLALMDLTVVAASDREGLSGVVRESLAMGVPVISTDCAGNREIVQDRKTGLLVPPGDAKALRDALLWAYEHQQEMRAMAEAGRAWVREHCSMEKQCESLERIYQSAMD